jgi:magnesium-transporting ATPase (P-type)
MKKLNGDRMISLLLMLFCGLSYYLSFSFSGEARAYPHFMIFCIFFFSLVLFVSTFINSKKKEKEKENSSKSKIDISRLLNIGILTVAYIVLLNKIGFYSSTAIYLLCAMSLLGIKNIKLLLFTTGIFLLLLYSIFNVFLQLPKPEGILF